MPGHPRGDPAQVHQEEVLGHTLFRWQGRGQDEEYPDVGGLPRRLVIFLVNSVDEHHLPQNVRLQRCSDGLRRQEVDEGGVCHLRLGASLASPRAR